MLVKGQDTPLLRGAWSLVFSTLKRAVV